eukprot:scaffold172775_cov22-Tisochrysis_lutea.AAC.2
MAAVPDSTKDAEVPVTAGKEAQEESGQEEFTNPLQGSWSDMLAWSCQQIKDLLGLAVVTEPNMNAVAPMSSYAAISCTNVIATSCQ